MTQGWRLSSLAVLAASTCVGSGCAERTVVHLLEEEGVQEGLVPAPAESEVAKASPTASAPAGDPAPPPEVPVADATTAAAEDTAANDAGPANAAAADAGAANLDLNFPDFNQVDGLTLVGEAMVVNNFLELVSPEQSQRGAAWGIDPVPWTETTRLAAEFSFRVFGEGTSAADGIVFVIQSDPRGNGAIGSPGGSLAYGGNNVSIQPSLGVEFDIHENDWDPDNNHVAIVHAGDVSTPLAVASDLPMSMRGGDRIFGWIDYEFGELRAFVANTPEKPADAIVTQPLSVLDTVGSEAFVGIVASNGDVAARLHLESLRIRIFDE